MGALHQADSDALRTAASAWHDEMALLPKPLLIVSIGGPTSRFCILLFWTLFYALCLNSIL